MSKKYVLSHISMTNYEDIIIKNASLESFEVLKRPFYETDLNNYFNIHRQSHLNCYAASVLYPGKPHSTGYWYISMQNSSLCTFFLFLLSLLLYAFLFFSLKTQNIRVVNDHYKQLASKSNSQTETLQLFWEFQNKLSSIRILMI